jgi:hypothetical protein
MVKAEAASCHTSAQNAPNGGPLSVAKNPLLVIKGSRRLLAAICKILYFPKLRAMLTAHNSKLALTFKSLLL